MCQLGLLREKGVSAVEILIGVSLVALILMFTSESVGNFVNAARGVSDKTEALYLTEDGLEILRYIRDNNWATFSSLPNYTTRYLTVTPTTLAVTTTPEMIGGFTRSFTVHPVYRDSTTDDIVSSTTPGSVADNNAWYATVKVVWGSPLKETSLSTILTNLDP